MLHKETNDHMLIVKTWANTHAVSAIVESMFKLYLSRQSKYCTENLPFYPRVYVPEHHKYDDGYQQGHHWQSTADFAYDIQYDMGILVRHVLSTI